MQKDEFESLKNDIQSNGFDKTRPVISFENAIIDGWHRYQACKQLDIEPVIVEFQGSQEDAIFYIISTNNRRNLNKGQMACMAVAAIKIIESIKAESKQGQRTDLTLGNNYPEVKIDNYKNRTASKLAEKFQTNDKYIKDAKRINKENPLLFARIEKGTITIPEALKELRTEAREKVKESLIEKANGAPASEKFKIFQGDIKTHKINRQFDFIITDPPYPKEYLSLYETLAERAKEWLTDDGLLIAMCGQSYVDEIYNLMSKHLTYYWTACYLTPGQPTPLRQKQVNTTWKPLLIFSKNTNYKGKIFGDVFRSERNDKDLHKWGQSQSGMYDIIKQVVLQGQSILDPFCGAGTTGMAAIEHNCFFYGIDIDEQNVKISKGRLNDFAGDDGGLN